MKSHLFSAVALLCGGLSLLSSCNKSENVLHQLSIQGRDVSMVTTLYADQAIDTLWVSSTDNWTANISWLPLASSTSKDSTTSTSTPTSDHFFTITPTEAKVVQGWILVTPIAIRARIPAEQPLQQAVLHIVPATSEIGEVRRQINQVGWLNISAPIAASNSAATAQVMPNFSETLRADAGSTRTVFDLYSDDASSQSLTSDAEWLIVPDNAQHPKRGHNVVDLTFTKNTSATPRTAHLRLSSAGATTIVTYTQLGQTQQ